MSLCGARAKSKLPEHELRPDLLSARRAVASVAVRLAVKGLLFGARGPGLLNLKNNACITATPAIVSLYAAADIVSAYYARLQRRLIIFYLIVVK